MKIISPGKVLKNNDLCESLLTRAARPVHVHPCACISYKNNDVTCTQWSSLDLCRQVDDVGFCNSLDYQFNVDG